MEEEQIKLQENCISFSKLLIAAGAVWVDSTSYSLYDKNRIPTSFSTKIGSCRVSITCGHRDYRPEWVFHCYELGFDTKLIGKYLTPQEAAERAIGICKDKVQNLYESFNTKLS